MIASTSIVIEVIQMFIPGRVSDIKDFILNTLGSYIFLIFQGIRENSKNSR